MVLVGTLRGFMENDFITWIHNRQLAIILPDHAFRLDNGSHFDAGERFTPKELQGDATGFIPNFQVNGWLILMLRSN